MFDEGSFRDPNGRVFYSAGRVFRSLTISGAECYDALGKEGVWKKLEEAGLAITSRRCDLDEMKSFELPEECRAVIEVQKVPFISYPYEWSFEMLRRAALTHLDILKELVPKGWILKDSSAYNYQFFGPQCRLMDLMSVEQRMPHESWLGYTQFCCHFLNPLLIASCLKQEPYALLRGRLDGIPVEMADAMVSFWQQWKTGAWIHIRVQAMLQRGTKDKVSERDLFRDLPDQKEMILALVARMRKLIVRLQNPQSTSVWMDYEQQHNYTDEGRRVKEMVLRDCVTKLKPELVFDLGANIGEFSRIAAEHAQQVVSFDLEGRVIDRLFQRMIAEKQQRILPLVMDLTNPSQDQGFAGKERKAWNHRGGPDLLIAFAVLHHMAIHANVPVKLMIEWLYDLKVPHLMIEFVPREDVMVRQLLKNRKDVYEDYTVDRFEEEVIARFKIVERIPIPSSPRFIFHLNRQ